MVILIDRCWERKEEYRPSFNEIVQLLETDPNFITPNVDKEEYLDYISLLKESLPNFLLLSQSCKKHNTLSGPVSAPLKHNTLSIKKPLNNLKIVEIESNEDSGCFLNLSKFERKEIIIKTDSLKIYKFKEIETGKFYAGQMSMLSINLISKSEVNSLTNELKKITKLKHPCLLKFIGYSPIDFKKQRKPVIVIEYFSNGSLSSVLELDRLNQPIQGWNSTKKLINLYGIASCMSYLHSQGIVHKALKPNNIYLDDILTPKIGDFGLSTKFEASESITVQSISGIKATPVYSSPEVLLNDEYSKSSDVYAFGFIAYEIICNEVPFNEIDNNNQKIHEIVINHKRPIIKESIPLSYRQLIEKCWAQEANERLTFDDIVYHLRMDQGFITDSIDNEDYQKYIKYIDDQLEPSVHQKIDELETINELEAAPNNETAFNKTVAANETEVNRQDFLKNASEKFVRVEEKKNDQFLTSDEFRSDKKEADINIESLEKNAANYIKENDTENIYRVLNKLIQMGHMKLAVSYATSLYQNEYYKQSFSYFKILSQFNHPIAKYFIGIMKFYGLGCEESREESYRILKYLSDNNIDKATEFLQEHFKCDSYSI